MDRLPEGLRESNALVLTVPQSKGLEFDGELLAGRGPHAWAWAAAASHREAACGHVALSGELGIVVNMPFPSLCRCLPRQFLHRVTRQGRVAHLAAGRPRRCGPASHDAAAHASGSPMLSLHSFLAHSRA